MKPTNFSYVKSLAKKLALALSLTLVICAPSVFAQGTFDVGTLSAETSTTETAAGGQAMNSMGATGNVGVTSYKSGEAPEDANMSGIHNGVTTKQLSGPQGTLLLNPAGYGRLAGVFGGGGYGWSPTPSLFTISLMGGAANAAVNVTGNGVGVTGNLNVGGTNLNINAASSDF